MATVSRARTLVNVVGARPPGTGLARLPSRVGSGDLGKPTAEEVACTIEGLNKYKGTVNT